MTTVLEFAAGAGASSVATSTSFAPPAAATRALGPAARPSDTYSRELSRDSATGAEPTATESLTGGATDGASAPLFFTTGGRLLMALLPGTLTATSAGRAAGALRVSQSEPAVTPTKRSASAEASAGRATSAP